MSDSICLVNASITDGLGKVMTARDVAEAWKQKVEILDARNKSLHDNAVEETPSKRRRLMVHDPVAQISPASKTSHAGACSGAFQKISGSVKNMKPEVRLRSPSPQKLC